jgi:hypothetical protein
MAYASLTDIQALNPKRQYGSLSTPTTTQVDLLIGQISSEIDMVMSLRYTLPITDTTLLAVLQTINAYGAAALAEQAMFPETVEKGSTPHWKMLWDAYQGWLKELKEGIVPLVLAGSNIGSDLDSGEEIDPPKFSMSESVRQF